MTEYQVLYEAMASYALTVDIDDEGMTEEQAREAARDKADDEWNEKAPSGSLCHHCAREYELGEFEQTADDDSVWRVA